VCDIGLINIVMISNYILCKALALYTGSKALDTLVDQMRGYACDDECFRYVRRRIGWEMDEFASDKMKQITFCVFQTKSGFISVRNSMFYLFI